jgi:hypothetical protein
MSAFFDANGFIGADFKAFTAIPAEGFYKADLRFSGQAFRVCTPLA